MATKEEYIANMRSVIEELGALNFYGLEITKEIKTAVQSKEISQVEVYEVLNMLKSEVRANVKNGISLDKGQLTRDIIKAYCVTRDMWKSEVCTLRKGRGEARWVRK